MSLPIFGFINELDFNHPACVVVFHYCFCLHAPNDIWWWAFHTSIGQMYIYFGEVPVQIFCALFFFVFSGLDAQHMEVPRLGVEYDLQLLACTTATTMWDQSHVWNLQWSSEQCQILNRLSRARDWTHIFMNLSQVCDCWATIGTS